MSKKKKKDIASLSEALKSNLRRRKSINKSTIAQKEKPHEPDNNKQTK